MSSNSDTSATAAAGPGLSEGLGAGAGARWRYYYRVTECKAKDAEASDCICWHAEGAGPFDTAQHDDPEQFLEWREAPNVRAKLRLHGADEA